MREKRGSMEIKVYSEKLGKEIIVSDTQLPLEPDDNITSLVGWSHGGWNNDNGGGSTW